MNRTPVAPDLPPDPEPYVGALQSRELLEAYLLDASVEIGTRVYDLSLKECVLREIDFSGRKLPGFRATDVVFETCDLSGAVLEEAALTRVRFSRCRLTGTVLSGSELQDVLVDECTADLLALRLTRANRLSVQASSLREADLYRASLGASSIVRCDLTGADVRDAQVPGLDLRGSVLDGLTGLAGLRGALIGSDQLLPLAGALAAELGITVED